jgi:asparagine synthase (glutamine-hydrolysing)
MCGIAGLFRTEGALGSGAPLAPALNKMNRVMAHRGPDGDGIWVSDDQRIGLAHRRLAIVDLSPDAAQPMSSADGSIQLTYNGEIYNHLKLRKELETQGHHFKTDHSDTEVLIHGYLEWGVEGLVKRLEGMFAFAIWDEKRHTLTLARDRIGIKPVYFARTGGTFRFASEIKALLIDPAIARRVDTSALNHYLSFMVAPAPQTMFQGIYKLPAAHIMEINNAGDLKAWRYWSALPGQGVDASETAGLSEKAREDFYVQGIRSRLEAAIEKRMMSDVPFGVFLSGGIDSSANVALMSQLTDRPVETFTVGFKDHTHLNELDYARKIADKFKTNHHEVLIDETDMMGYLDQLVHHQDEPIADWVCIPLYFVSKLARDNGVTVVQVGEGADEQFCGYDSWMTYLRFFNKFWDPYTKFTPGPVKKLMGSLGRSFAPATRGRGGQIAEALHRAATGQELFFSGANAFWNIHKNRLLGNGVPDSSTIHDDLAGSGIDLTGISSPESGEVINGYFGDLASEYPAADHLTRMAYSEFRLRLPELLLMRVDKISMSTSIEGRVPFLDHDLVEFTMDIPQAYKVKGGIKKHLLKQAVGDLLPDEIIHRKKMGFAAPVEQWLRGDFGKEAEARVLSSPLLRDGLLSKSYVAARFKEHREGKADHALHLWTLFNLTSWHEHWMG